MNNNEKMFGTGFKTMILGICLYILELLYLPVFGTIQKELSNSHTVYDNVLKYAEMQPYPIVFALTGIVVVAGIVLMVLGHKKPFYFP